MIALRERLAALEPGWTPQRPTDVVSASQIEVRAESTPCLRCDGPYRIDEHTADQVNGRLIRTVDVHCGFCGARRKMYFRVVAAGS